MVAEAGLSPDELIELPDNELGMVLWALWVRYHANASGFAQLDKLPEAFINELWNKSSEIDVFTIMS